MGGGKLVKTRYKTSLNTKYLIIGIDNISTRLGKKYHGYFLPAITWHVLDDFH